MNENGLTITTMSSVAGLVTSEAEKRKMPSCTHILDYEYFLYLPVSSLVASSSVFDLFNRKLEDATAAAKVERPMNIQKVSGILSNMTKAFSPR